jgi:hypothetical protein
MAPQKKNKSLFASFLKSKCEQRKQSQQASAGLAQIKADVSATSIKTTCEQQQTIKFFLYTRFSK